MAYEDGMSISFDHASGKVAVFFRGEKHLLPGVFKTRDEGIAAGEAFCRNKGWKPSPHR